MNDTTKHSIEDWIENLSPETAKNLDAVLSAVISNGEVLSNQHPFEFGIKPINYFHFERKSVFPDTAVGLLKVIENKTGEQFIVNEGVTTHIGVTKTSVELLKEIQRILTKKLATQKTFSERHQFPSDLKWQEITIRFLNEHEVIIQYRKEQFQATYELMGFNDKRSKLPNRQWQFLYGLAKTLGSITWQNPNASTKGKKQKQLLADGLKKYFRIKDDPFYNYKKGKTYEIKISLVSEIDDTSFSQADETFGIHNLYGE